jgi:pimeloyl-ACP methyl ester carboxylesterase
LLIKPTHQRTQRIEKSPRPDAAPAKAPAKAPAESESVQAPTDMLDMLPSNWNDIDTQEVVLPSSKPPHLERPVVFLHGFNGNADRWGKVTEWLTSEDSGNKYGGIIDAGKFDNIDPESNLFTLRLSRPYNSVEVNKAELRATVEAVLEATGAEEVDLIVHSLGGLNARAYLQDDDEKVNKLIQLGTPNKGSQLANMEIFMRENFDYPVLPPVDDPEVRRVLDQLSVDKLDRAGNPQNPWLRALNDDWSNQRSAADVMLVAGAGVPTLTGGPGITVFGDGVVTRRSAKMDGIENKTIWFRTHGGIQNSTKVMENMAKFLTGQELTVGENLFDKPEDAVRAARMLDKSAAGESQKSKRAAAEDVRRAVRLPLLDPAFQIGLGLGVLSAIMGGPKENLPLVEIALSSANSQNEIHADYDIDLLRESNPVKGSGIVNGTSFAEVANLKEGKVHWDSALNLQSSGLIMEVGEDEESVLMKGQLGGVPTDLTLAMMKDENGRMSGLSTTGTFNGEPYNVQSAIDLEGLILGQPQHHSNMKVTGTVNGEPVDRTYQVNVKREKDNLSLSAHHTPHSQDQQLVGVEVKVKERPKS